MASENSGKITSLRYQITQLEQRIEDIEYYENQAKEQVLVWCVDLGDITVGSRVGTIEVDREKQGLNIHPAYETGAQYDSERDGVFQYFGVMNPYAKLLNAIIAPGVESWKPRYRYGTIYDINKSEDIANVNLETYSSEFYRDVLNQVDNLYGLKIEYMDCNSAPFEEGDVVVVEFDDTKWGQGKIIGFKSNPKPCNDEIVFFSLGELGILWDIKTNAYVEGFTGPTDYADCIAYLADKTETTLDNQYYGLPYTRLLRTFYTDAAYNNYHEKFTTWGLTAHGENPGYLYDKPEISYSVTEVDGVFESRTEWDETITPWGSIAPAYLHNFFYTEGPFGPIFQAGGVNLYDWSSWDYMESHFVCPLDEDESYYSYGTDAEYGNDAIGIGYPGAVMSEISIVQVLFNSHAYIETIDDEGVLRTIYTSSRETEVLCTCGNYPWEVDDSDESDPQLMDINAEFSMAVYDLIEALHALRGVEIMYDSPDYETSVCLGPSTTSDNCENSLCNYWYSVVNPKMELKIYKS